MSKAVNAVIVGLTVFILLTGSIWYVTVARSPNKVSAVEVEQGWETVNSTTSAIWAEVTFRNPYDFRIEMITFTYEFWINGERIVANNTTQEVRMVPRGQAMMPARVVLNTTDMDDWFHDHIANGERSEVWFTGNATFRVGGGELSVPFETRQNWETNLRRNLEELRNCPQEAPSPCIADASVKWVLESGQSLLQLVLTIRNNNLDEMTITNRSATLTFGEVAIASNEGTDAVVVARESSRFFEFPLDVDRSKIIEWWIRHVEACEKSDTNLNVVLDYEVKAQSILPTPTITTTPPTTTPPTTTSSTRTVTLGLSGSPMTENAGVATLTGTLSAASDEQVTITLGFTGTATHTDDYTRSGVQIVIPAGSTTGSRTMTAVQDTLDEPDETIIVEIAAVTNAVESGSQQVTAAITDDDGAPPPTRSVTLGLAGDPMAEDGGVSTVSATLSGAAGQDVTVDLGFSGAATNGDDYTRSSAQIVIPAGSTSGSVTLTAVQDAVDEADETIIVDITGVTNAEESGSQQVTATITDDDAPPPPPTVPEANLTADVTNGSAPLIVNFTIKDDAGAAVTGWTLVFGDGNSTTGTSVPASATHSYETPGTYQAILTVHSAAGDDTDSVTITAEQPPAQVPAEPSSSNQGFSEPTSQSWTTGIRKMFAYPVKAMELELGILEPQPEAEGRPTTNGVERIAWDLELGEFRSGFACSVES